MHTKMTNRSRLTISHFRQNLQTLAKAIFEKYKTLIINDLHLVPLSTDQKVSGLNPDGVTKMKTYCKSST